MTREQEKRDNTIKITEHPNDVIVNELERITDAIIGLKEDMKKMCENMTIMSEHIKMISKPEMPPVNVTVDLEETNKLLMELLTEEQKPEEPVEIKLKVE